MHCYVLAFPELTPPGPNGGKCLSTEEQLIARDKLNVDWGVLLPGGGMEAQWHLISTANAMMRDPKFAAGFLAEFADRIYYGTDVRAFEQTCQYKFDAFLTGLVDTNMISRETYEKIIHKNAAKLLCPPNKALSYSLRHFYQQDRACAGIPGCDYCKLHKPAAEFPLRLVAC